MGYIMSMGYRMKAYHENGKDEQEEEEEQGMREEEGEGIEDDPKVGPLSTVIPLSPYTMTSRSCLGL